MIQLEIPLFDHLQIALSAPQEAELLDLLRLFDTAISGLEDRVCLAVAADAIVQLATIFEAKYGEVSKQVAQFKADVRGERNEPVVSIDFFDRFVRQSMMVNFDQFIEPIERLPLPSHLNIEGLTLNEFQADYISEAAMTQAILDVVIDDAAALLDALPDRTLEQKQLDDIQNLSHGEEIEV